MNMLNIAMNCEEEERLRGNLEILKEKVSLFKTYSGQKAVVNKSVSTAVALPEKKEVEAEGVAEVFITKDKDLLDQYYKLRNEIFHADRGWTKKEWLESEYDRDGTVIVATKNGEVVGGLRMMNSIDNKLLSGELSGSEFRYPNLLKKLEMNSSAGYAELDGLVVKRGKRNRDSSVVMELTRLASDYSRNIGCKYLIAIASGKHCRSYKIVVKKLGYSKVVIAKNFPWIKLEEYNYSEDYPIICVLDK